MIQTKRYIQWQNTSKNIESRVAEIMKHWELRFELGTAMLLCNDPEVTLKLVEKNWRKLCRQLQSSRSVNSQANDILELTRTISRMQRVKFTTQPPENEPNATFYVGSASDTSSVPAHCFTLYTTEELPSEEFLSLLSPESLVVAPKHLKKDILGFDSKNVLEEKLLKDESNLVNWLRAKAILLDDLQSDVEKSNEALDTILSSASLQSEFISKSQLFLHTLQLAQPLKLTESQQERLSTLKTLEQHVRVLSPAFLSDHIINSQDEDSFLLKDPASGRTLTLDSLRQFIADQYSAGRINLAKALELKAGFVSIT